MGFGPDNQALPGDLGCAMLGHTANALRTFRDGYDMGLPILNRCFVASCPGRPAWASALDPNESRLRPHTAVFFGTVLRWEEPGWRDRWMALMVLGKTPGFLVRVHSTPGTAFDGFDEALRDAKFALCFSGAGLHSYRFRDALEAGAVPVVTDDVVLPFESWRSHPRRDVFQWDKCVVRVPQEKILFLADILGEAKPL